ncbi:MAG: GatB/YqeY domain-containing protein [Proteobacteria bacterium]|nr:GatB/YqeY domain-containing protein [Pseudomonadota bacterium]MBS0574515.1 GatB/YqeY domain-containing protein [Pseudomonadota bacterium]
MELVERIQAAQKEAMKARDTLRLSAVRMILAAVKDREIALRASGEALTGAEVLALLGKMVKQRQESARVYDEGGRADLAGKERAEVGVIEEFLPRAMSAAEVEAAIGAAIAEAGAASLRDMGKVMALLKARHAGQMDFAAAGAQVKARLG